MTAHLIKHLSFRAAEVPMTIILTQRPSQSLLKLTDVLKESLGEEFRRIYMPPLNEMESLQLAAYIDRSSKNKTALVQSSGGNPLFIEDHARYGIDSAGGANRKEALLWMRSQIPKQARDFAETLSLFKTPVEVEALAIESLSSCDLKNK